MLLHRSINFVAIVLIAQLSGCADAERETRLSSDAPEIGTYFVDHGVGEPVVLVYGFSQTHAAWLQTPLYEDLVRDHRVIAVDLRGHGDSDKPHDPMSYEPNLRSDLVALLDHDSAQAAILSEEFTQVARDLITSNSTARDDLK